MDQFQHDLLMFIDSRFVNINEYNSFDKIIDELTPTFRQKSLPLNQTEISTALAALMDAGHIESTGKNYRITNRGLIYTRLHPTVIQFLTNQSEDLNRRQQSSIAYLWLGVFVAIVLSLLALFVK